MAAFMPGQSPPDVSIPIVFISAVIPLPFIARSSRAEKIRLLSYSIGGKMSTVLYCFQQQKVPDQLQYQMQQKFHHRGKPSKRILRVLDA
jgi:hypothetical protein